jgi:hypothetical protein
MSQMDNYLSEHTLSGDGGALVALAPGKEKSEVLRWDLSAVRKFAARERPELPKEEWERLWQELTKKNTNAAFKAMRRLAASPKQTLPILKDRLRPVPKERAKVSDLVRRLDSDAFVERQKAQDALLAASHEALPALREAAKEDRSLESKRRIEGLIVKAEEGTRRALWAIEMLEFLGNRDAKEVLGRLAGGDPAGWITLEAQASLKRLGVGRAT